VAGGRHPRRAGQGPVPVVTIGPDGGRSGPGPWRHLTGWVRTHPGMAVALCVPVVVFGLPQLFGGTYLTGDNLIQNLPMRALVGTDLAHGIWPLWNPYLFSGTPLLGGFNAGAAYPVTWLTAVFPLFTAWTLTLIVTYDLALAGMYLFLRHQPLSVTAATFGAVTFTFAGYMTGQLVHVDLIEGAAWLPWILTSVHALTGGGRRPHPAAERAARRRTRRWAMVLAVSLGMSLLSGNAEGMIDGAVLVTVYLVGRLVTTGLLRRDQRRLLATSATGLVCGMVAGVALGAAQWLPGLVFLSQSQRAVTTYSYFTSESLSGRSLVLLASPFAMGTNQNVPNIYVGTYNFPEVTSYMGILAMIAACSLFLKRWRSRPGARHWWIWYVILVIGVLSALGNDTPFGHLMYAIPGIRNERLLNRNILLIDFSLAVLLGWWVHVLLADREDRPPVRTTLRSRWSQSRSEVITICIPVAVMAGVCTLIWADGSELERLLAIQFPIDAFHRVRVAILVTAQLAVAGWATWTVLVERRFTARRLSGLLAAVLVTDLVLFNVFVVQPPISEATAQVAGPSSAALSSLTGDGRFIIYDPDELYDGELLALGQTDLNIYGRLPSAQGYTALTNDNYYQATGTHYQEDLDPETLAGPTWDSLNVTTLVSLPGYFVTPLPPAPGSRAPAPTVVFPGDVSTERLTPDPVPDRIPLAPGTPRRWYFGGVLTVRSWSVPVLSGSSSSLRVGLVGPTGGLQWLPAADATTVEHGQATTVRVTVPSPVRAGGIVVEAAPSSPAVLGTPDAATVEAGDVALDGRMQFGVTAPHWTFTGMLGSFGVFHNDDPQGWARIRGVGGGAAPRGSSVTAVATGQGGSSRISVHTTGPAVLVRSESWSPGWTSTVQAATTPGAHAGVGPATAVAVEQDGVLQQVAVPGAGDYLVTFTYAPTSATAGLVVSGVTAVVLALAATAELVAARRRRRRARPDPGRAPAPSSG
jgi:hypothetical protein